MNAILGGGLDGASSGPHDRCLSAGVAPPPSPVRSQSVGGSFPWVEVKRASLLRQRENKASKDKQDKLACRRG